MGKGRHSKDKLYITSTEWKDDYGGKKNRMNHSYQALPFDHCALTLSPFETPVCNSQGILFDLVALVPFIRKHKCDPVTGQPMTTNDIIRLNMSKDAEGQWQCPTLCKVFTNNVHVVAIRSTGNVFSFEAVNELNLKMKNFTDLLTGEPFTRSDIITLQNPNDPEHMALRDVSNFKHLQTMRDDMSELRASDKKIRHNPMSEKIMKSVNEHIASGKSASTSDKDHLLTNRIVEKESDIEDVKEILNMRAFSQDLCEGRVLSDQKAGSSLTSSYIGVHTANTMKYATAAEAREARWRKMKQLGKKGYVQLETTLGNINLEIHCDICPMTSWNFITLCSRGYYENTIFHRLVKGFIVQGGDPTGTGGGGESAWGHAFKDEFDSRLQHDKRGVLSMANSGGNTNGSQFFITFQNAPHLDLNHAIFGRVVGGMACLERMESVPSDKHEHPQTEIKLIKANVVVNPIIESDALLLEEISNTIATRIRNQVPTCVDTMAISSSSSSRNLIPISESYDSDNNVISVKANPTQTTSMVGTQRSNSHATENKNTISSSADSKPYIAERKTARKSSSNSGSDADIAAFLRSQGGDSMYTHDSKKRKNNPDEDKFSYW